jgi:hypothetical protein
MNYCSLKDAWGSNDHISKQFKEYMSPHLLENDNLEKFTNNDTNPEPIKTERICTNINCDDIITHIKTCKKCYKKIKNHMRNRVLENFEDIINDNRDSIVLILIGLSIILFINLINNITK